MKKGNVWALLPIGVFVVLYLSLGIIFEYVMDISMGFELSAFEVIAHLFYPMLLLVSSLIFIFLVPERAEKV